MTDNPLQLQREIQTQEVVNKLLQASLEDLSLERTLERAIDAIVSAPLFPMKSKGAIFLVGEEPDTLIMRAQRGLPEYLLQACARVPFGYCLCGRTARNRDVLCSAQVDQNHDVTYDGMSPHGHYCVPILLQDRILGVITLYTDAGHAAQASEISFLRSVSYVLAGVIQRRKAEAELKETQMQLLQAEKLASIGQLAAGIAHEINNPLCFIGGSIDIFKDHAESFLRIYEYSEALAESIEHNDFEKARDLTAKLKNAGGGGQFESVVQDMQSLFKASEDGISRIKRIIDDLKDFSSGRGDAEQDIQVDTVMEQILNIASNAIKRKAEIHKDYAPTPPVKGDPQKLGQVFMNILINAAQAIKETGTITISTRSDEKQVYIRIKDTGNGIPASILGKIFDPFFTTKPIGEGMGLGLSISYDIIKKMGGSIVARSTVGQGCEFTIALPPA
ncbi:MAG: ATP-binding protein [Elusimicrobiota bacterium]|jgi:signal transduction histidine kinase